MANKNGFPQFSKDAQVVDGTRKGAVIEQSETGEHVLLKWDTDERPTVVRADRLKLR